MNKYSKWIEEYTSYQNLPDNIQDYCLRNYCNLQINICNTDAINGYGIRISGSIIVMMYCEKCMRPLCEYNSLFNSMPEHSCHDRGGRHSIDRCYENVFEWYFDSEVTLEDAFNQYLEQNSGGGDIKPMVFYRKRW